MTEDFSRDRCLRNKKGHSYKDDGIDDDEIYGQRTFDLQSKLDSYPDNNTFYNDMKGSDVTLTYFQQNGFKTPILVKEKAGLGMRMPSENFTVSDVKKCVGSWRMVDVMDVTTQKDLELTMKEWVAYYENPKRDRLLNVISLEFSHTKLENYVDQPAVVHDLDWVDLAWPGYLKEMQSSATNLLTTMMYPKVQKYCLMSVAGCYTDFHIDMGGTSVWYHILRGQKVFWFIEPTEENLKLYENWTLSAKQSDVFFGDLVKNCYKITLEAGNTFFIPTGWIHAVYTPCDSLVFGGNFLHSFGIELQLRIWEVETKTHVPMKFRYPFFMELHWYVLERYLYVLSGRKYSIKLNEEVKDEIRSVDESMDGDPNDNPSDSFAVASSTIPSTKLEMKPNKFLTLYELLGLKLITLWLQNIPRNKLNIPRDIINTEQLLCDLEKILGFKELNNQSKAITGIPFLERILPKKPRKYNTTGCRGGGSSSKDKSRASSSSVGGSVWHYRRVRCKQCEPCTRTDCSECFACVDMKKFGGPGILKKPCLSRQCMQPILPATAVCFTCKKPSEDKTCIEPGVGLLECTICFEVHHRECLQNASGDSLTHQGCIDEDFPSSWECSRCCSQGKQGQGRTRFRPPMVGPGEARKRGPKKNGNAADAASEINGDSDCDSSILDDSTSRRGSTKRARREGSDLNATTSAKKVKQEDKIKLDIQLSESRVVLTRLKTDDSSIHSQDTAKDDEDDQNIDDHSYSSKVINDSVQGSTGDKSKIFQEKLKNTSSNSIKVHPSDGEVESADDSLSANENEETSTPRTAQRLNSRGRIISKPHRYMD